MKKKPQYFKPIPELIDEFGMPHPTARQAADGWVQAFVRIEGGDITTADRIVDIVFKEGAMGAATTRDQSHV